MTDLRLHLAVWVLCIVVRAGRWVYDEVRR